MTGVKAIERMKDRIARCNYSTMRGVKYIALELEEGVLVTIENKDTIWKWWVVDKKQPALKEIKHKKNKKTSGGKKDGSKV